MKTLGRILSLFSLFAWQQSWAAEPVTKLKADEAATLFPAVGWRDPAGDGWLIEFHGWVYEREPRRFPIAVLQKVVGLKLDDLAAEEKQCFKERSRWFLLDNERGKQLHVSFANLAFDLGKTEANGHVSKLIAILEETCRQQGLNSGTNVVSLCLNAKDERKICGTVHLIPEEGWTVVSDIDDTIKVTEVRDQVALVRNTFCRPFKAAEGMAGVYQQWAGQGAVFHYVSASPWQLYPDLETFRGEAGYPAGSFHLRELRFKDRTGLEFVKQSKKFKPETIAELLLRYPKRQFVLVGDSGEHDPEIYAELARQHPGQITRILIRNVTNEAADAPRYRETFKDVPPAKWAVFQHPNEVKQLGPIKLETK